MASVISFAFQVEDRTQQSLDSQAFSINQRARWSYSGTKHTQFYTH